MKSYNEFKAEMKAIHQLVAKAKKNKHAYVLKEVKLLCKEFGFNTRILKVSLDEV